MDSSRSQIFCKLPALVVPKYQVLLLNLPLLHRLLLKLHFLSPFIVTLTSRDKTGHKNIEIEVVSFAFSSVYGILEDKLRLMSL